MSGSNNVTKTIINIQQSDLPLSCPNKSQKDKWALHPRVFLTLDEEGKAQCPYCGSIYILGGVNIVAEA